MVSIKKNVETLIKARGLSREQLSARVGMDDEAFDAFLQEVPKRSDTKLKKIARELLVPDFLLFAEEPPLRERVLPDFRLSQPSGTGYSRETLKWIDFAVAIQEHSGKFYSENSSRLIRSLISSDLDVTIAAKKLRDALDISEGDQMSAPDARSFYSLIRQRVERLSVFVLQLSFPDNDGAGFCLAGNCFDVIVVNTKKQNHARRLFTLAHEIYHCSLSASGVSDPEIVKNKIERTCNQFAVEFIAPEHFARALAASTITTRSLLVSEVQSFSKMSKLSMYASVLRLVELGIYDETAIGAWQQFVATTGYGDVAVPSGGRRVEEWKYKLGKYGFQFARVFGSEAGRDYLDPLELFHFSGIKPKYQSDYFKNARSASADEALEDQGWADE